MIHLSQLCCNKIYYLAHLCLTRSHAIVNGWDWARSGSHSPWTCHTSHFVKRQLHLKTSSFLSSVNLDNKMPIQSDRPMHSGTSSELKLGCQGLTYGFSVRAKVNDFFYPHPEVSFEASPILYKTTSLLYHRVSLFFLHVLNCRLSVCAIKGLCKHTRVGLNAFHFPAFACEKLLNSHCRFSADPGFVSECLQVGVFRWMAVFGLSDRTHTHIITSMYKPQGMLKWRLIWLQQKSWLYFAIKCLISPMFFVASHWW